MAVHISAMEGRDFHSDLQRMAIYLYSPTVQFLINANRLCASTCMLEPIHEYYRILLLTMTLLVGITTLAHCIIIGNSK